MQRLFFEAAWDKTIAPQDRSRIEEIFAETAFDKKNDIAFSPVREAVNHRKELLVTVLVHNFKNQEITFADTKLGLRCDGKLTAEHVFSMPLSIPPETSMPWTFIFPAGSWTGSPSGSHLMFLS